MSTLAHEKNEKRNFFAAVFCFISGEKFFRADFFLSVMYFEYSNKAVKIVHEKITPPQTFDHNLQPSSRSPVDTFGIASGSIKGKRGARRSFE
jgi:hypothetical protein